MQETWEGLSAAVDQGLVKSIGVSNHSPEKIHAWFQKVRVPVSVNQVSNRNYGSKLLTGALDNVVAHSSSYILMFPWCLLGTQTSHCWASLLSREPPTFL